MNETIFLTGYNGFIGSATIRRLIGGARYQIIASTRRESNIEIKGVQTIPISNIDGNTNWSLCLANVHVVIHTAARVHMMKDSSLDPLFEFRKVNVEGTLNLARQAVENGVKRFIFISSIKVNGEFTDSTHKVFQSDDKPNPIDPYGISKFEAEEGLRQLSKETGLEVVIIRPPLVYGPGVKANFLSMMKWVNRGIPLPLGSINNKRSLVALDNLVDLIVTCIHHPKAKNQTFLVSDGEDLSTSDLLKRMASAMNKKILLIQIPVICFKLCAILIGRKNLSQRLMSSLQVDITKTRDLLGWNPPVSIDQAMLITAQAFLKDR